jgi:uncharacterized OB-fold protein
MKKCGQCGQEYSDEKKYCLRCGISLDQEIKTDMLICGLCGTVNKPDFNFCKKCGGQFTTRETDTVSEENKLNSFKSGEQSSPTIKPVRSNEKSIEEAIASANKIRDAIGGEEVGQKLETEVFPPITASGPKVTASYKPEKNLNYVKFVIVGIAISVLIVGGYLLKSYLTKPDDQEGKDVLQKTQPVPAPAPPPVSSQVRITRSVIAVAVGSDNQPLGVDTTFNEDTVRNSGKLVYYVSYDGAISNQTKFKAMWYRDGNVIANGDDYTIQYLSGNFYNTLNYNFTPGNYEARLFVDGNEVDKTFFSVSASSADTQRTEKQKSFAPPSRDDL